MTFHFLLEQISYCVQFVSVAALDMVEDQIYYSIIYSSIMNYTWTNQKRRFHVDKRKLVIVIYIPFKDVS